MAVALLIPLTVVGAPPIQATPGGGTPSASYPPLPPVSADYPPAQPAVPGASIVAVTDQVTWDERIVFRVTGAAWRVQMSGLWDGTRFTEALGVIVGESCPSSGSGASTCRMYRAPHVGEWGFTGTGWAVFSYVFRASAGDPVGSLGTVYVPVVPPDRTVVSGTLTTKAGAVVPGVTVTARGADAVRSVRTGPLGTYSMLLPNGRYTIRPTGAWRPAQRVLTLRGRAVTADFVQGELGFAFDIDGSRLIDGLDWTTVAASGTERRFGTVTATAAGGTPLADAVVELDRPYWDVPPAGGEAAPRLAVCDGTWRNLFATGERVERITDGDGAVPFTLLFGSDAGNALFHARLAQDVTALDVERLGVLGSVTGPDVGAVVDPMQRAASLGLAQVPLSAASAASLQAGLVEWWLTYRAGLGPADLARAGEFVPIRTADNADGGLLFYPAGNAAPVRAHLDRGDPLPAGYPTIVIGLRFVPVDPIAGGFARWVAVLTDPPALPQWEASHGPAEEGLLVTGAWLGGTGWLGGPYPPSLLDPAARAQYRRCVPGAAPESTLVQVHSPLGVTVDERSGAFAAATGRRQPGSWVVPTGEPVELSLRGTGTGQATVIVRAGARAWSYRFAVRKGTTGALDVSAAGRPDRLEFGGRVVRATGAPGLEVTGLAGRLTAGRTTRMRVTVRDPFGMRVGGAVLRARGAGVEVLAVADSRGRVRLAIRPSRRGTVAVTAGAPGYASSRRAMQVSG